MSPVPYKVPHVLPAYVLKMNGEAARAEEKPKKVRKPGKPRKRRTQTLADKGAGSELYHWQELLDSFVFAPADNVSANLQERDGKWLMHVVIDGKKYVGERPTLEEAFKATDCLLYEKAKHFWLRSIARCVIAQWGNSVPEAL